MYHGNFINYFFEFIYLLGIFSIFFDIFFFSNRSIFLIRNLFFFYVSLLFLYISYESSFVLLNFHNFFEENLTFFRISTFFLGAWIFFIKYYQKLYKLGNNFSSKQNFSKKEELFEILYLFAITMAIFSIYMIFLANDFLFIYLCLELFSLSSVLLIFFDSYFLESSLSKNDCLSLSLFYFIGSTLGSVIFLLGVVFIYSSFGEINFQTLQSFIFSGDFFMRDLSAPSSSHFIWDKLSDIWFFSENDIVFLFGFLLVLIGVSIKGGLAPFFFISYFVYKRLSYFTLTFFLIFPKLLLIYIYFLFDNLVRHGLDGLIDLYFYYFLIIIAVLNILVGLFLGLVGSGFKNFLVSSSLMNYGYLIFCFVFSSVYLIKFFVFFTFLMIYFISTLGLMFPLCFNNFRIFNFGNEVFFSDWSSCSYILRLYFSFFLFSLMGIPFFIGFWSKSFLLLSIVESNFLFLGFFIVLLSNALSVFLYLRIVTVILFPIPSSIFNVNFYNFIFDLIKFNSVKNNIDWFIFSFFFFLLLTLNILFFGFF